MTSPYTVRIEDPADDPESLSEGLQELERRCGCVVSCETLDGRLRRQRRDGFLVHALEQMPGDTLSKKAQELAAAIARFEGTTWPRWSLHGTPPSSSKRASAAVQSIFQARMLGLLPTTPRQLCNIFRKREGRGNFQRKLIECVIPDPDPGMRHDHER